MKTTVNPELWRKELRKPLPGPRAQEKMAPVFRDEFPHPSDPVRAAVLALLYPSAGKTHLVFIKRNEYKGHHSAQVSFPGGAWEKGDGTLEDTALRECREELGISDWIDILGPLTRLHIPVSNFLVSPYLGWLDRTPVFYPDRSEVQYVIEVSLEELMDPRSQSSERISRHEQTVEAPCYKVAGEKIWGATAMMLSELLEFVSRLP